MYKIIIQKIKAFIFPDRCLLCGKIQADSNPLCPECRGNIKFCKNNPVFKDICMTPGKKWYAFTVFSPFYYEGSIRKGILAIKFKSRKKSALFFAPYMANAARSDIFNDIDFAVCIPSSKNREKSRGFNQSEILAKSFCIQKGIIFKENFLIKVKDNVSQSTINNYEDRRNNVKGIFKINYPEQIQNKKILIIDDVFTTGATLKECSDLLIDNGAEAVICLTAASKRQNRKS